MFSCLCLSVCGQLSLLSECACLDGVGSVLSLWSLSTASALAGTEKRESGNLTSSSPGEDKFPGSHSPLELIITSSLLSVFCGMLDLHSRGTFLTGETAPHPPSLVLPSCTFHTPMVGQRPLACDGPDSLGCLRKSLHPLGFVSLSLRWDEGVFELWFWHAYTALLMLLGQTLSLFWEQISILHHANMEAKMAPCTKWLLDLSTARWKPKVGMIKRDFIWLCSYSLHQTGWNCTGHRICRILLQEEWNAQGKWRHLFAEPPHHISIALACSRFASLNCQSSL